MNLSKVRPGLWLIQWVFRHVGTGVILYVFGFHSSTDDVSAKSVVRNPHVSVAIECPVEREISLVRADLENVEEYKRALYTVVTSGGNESLEMLRQRADRKLRQLLTAANVVSTFLQKGFDSAKKLCESKDLCDVQLDLLRLYRTVGDSFLRYKDRIARASVAAGFCLSSSSCVRETDDDSGICSRLISSFLLDYGAVFSAARLIREGDQQGRPSPLSVRLAKQLELGAGRTDLEFDDLRSAVQTAMRLALHQPESGLQLSAGIGPILCDALSLFPQKENELAKAYKLLIRSGDGNLVAGTRFYQFEEGLSQVFYLRPVVWKLSQASCGRLLGKPSLPSLVPPKSHEPFSVNLHVSASQYRSDLDLICRNSGSGLPPNAVDDDRTICRILEEATAHLGDRSLAWKPWHRYGLYFHELSIALQGSAGTRLSAREARDFLAMASSDFLLKGVLLSPAPAKSSDLKKIRRDLASQVVEHARILAKELRWEDMATFIHRYLQEGEERFHKPYSLKLHILAAEAYYMQGDTVQALTHIYHSEGETCLEDLEKKAQQLRRLGIQAGPRNR